jgi:SAM-dependent methyltransferase
MTTTRVRRSSYRYVLGDSAREAARLRAQARLWDPVSRALFDRLKIRKGWRVLEVGPGQGSLHLELRRRVRGPVDAVEPSAAFRQRLRRACRRDGLGEGRVFGSTLLETTLPEAHYDLVFARWVFLFLPDAAAHVRHLAAALKPGGLLALQDYHRDTFAMVPRPDEWGDFLAADRGFFATQGGDASVGSRLPQMFEAAGLAVTDITPTVKTGHPRSAVWTWISTYFRGVIGQYSRMGLFTAAQGRRLLAHWAEAEQNKSSLLMAPAVLDVVGRKPKMPNGSRRT